jgi:hypothetical protein
MVVARRGTRVGVRRSSARLAMGVALAMVICPVRDRWEGQPRKGEFSSVLRFIEDNWNLRPFLTGRDHLATPMLSAFDFSQPPRAPDPLPEREDCAGPTFTAN